MSLKIESRSVNESFARVASLGVCGSAGSDGRRNIGYQNRRQRGGHKLHRPRLSRERGEIYIWVGLFDDGLVRIRIRDRGCGIADVRQAMEPLFTTLGGERAGLGFAVMETLWTRCACAPHRTGHERYHGQAYKRARRWTELNAMSSLKRISVSSTPAPTNSEARARVRRPFSGRLRRAYKGRRKF